MRNAIRDIENLVRKNPELEMIAKEGLLLTIKKIREVIKNAEKWNKK